MTNQKEIERLLKRTTQYRYIQIKENKNSYYAVDAWLDQYDYNLQLQSAILSGINVPVDKVPETMFRRLNWNQMNYENLETVFLLTMSEHVEKIHNPLDIHNPWEQ